MLSVPEPARAVADPETMTGGQLLRALPRLPPNHHRFWWWIEAGYSVIGWVVVSLAVLTFAQVNKVRPEPATAD